MNQSILRKVTLYCIKKREHVLNTSSYIFSRLVSLALFALSLSYFMNRAGAKKYGVLAVILIIYNLNGLFDFGFGYSVGYRLTRAHARNNKDAWQIIQRSLPFYLVICIFIGFVLYLLSEDLSLFLFKSLEYKSLFQITSVGCALLIFTSLTNSILQSYNKIYFSNLSKLSLDVIRALSFMISALTYGNLKIVVIGAVFGTVVKLLIELVLIRKLIGHMKWLKPVFSARDILFNFRFGVPMFIVVANVMLISSIDKLYIAKVFSTSVLSYYSVASDLHNKAFFLVYAVISSLITVLTRRAILKSSIIILLLIMFASVLIILVIYYLPLLLFAKSILTIWIGSNFAEQAKTLVRVMIIVTIPSLIDAVFYVLLQSFGKMKDVAIAYSIATLFFLISLYGFSKFYTFLGIYAVVYSFTIMYIVRVFICVYFVYQRQILRLKPL
jgi:O-antigen/teichoic acid export membrane protein